MSFDYPSLKARARRIEDRHPAIALRVHRAVSWLGRAERCGDDDDGRFIFLWIALNAAYSDEIQRESTPEQTVLDRFLKRLVELDRENLLYELVWSRFPGPFRMLLENRYVFQPVLGLPGTARSTNGSGNALSPAPGRRPTWPCATAAARTRSSPSCSRGSTRCATN